MSKSYILITIKTFSGLHISTTTTLENIFVINTIYEFNLEISKFLERLLSYSSITFLNYGLVKELSFWHIQSLISIRISKIAKSKNLSV